DSSFVCATTAATGCPSRSRPNGLPRFSSSSRARGERLSRLAGSEIPRGDEFETRRFEVRQVAGRQAPAVEAHNGRDHSVGRCHGAALSQRCTHNVAVGERGGFGEREDPVGKAVAPSGQALLQAQGPLVGANSPDTEAIFAMVTVDNASSALCRTSQAITGLVQRLRDKLVSRKIKAPVLD